ncbi:phospholipase D-like domain-containing protein, partial [Xanthomonas hortorum]|uniref:phospholipase D-like domain-containing protein n=1 Tax=Xanthomonas hortorum TaxID=56454 RepID=UPI00201378E6
MAQAREEILLETFIIYDDKVGQPLRQALIDAARRGVRVEVAVDGYGTADLPDDFISSMTEAGVRFHSFDPQPRLVGMRTNLFRRLHRKILVIDGQRAFIGGINIIDDYDDRDPTDGTTGPRFDFAVQVQGPLVTEAAYAQELLWVRLNWARLRRHPRDWNRMRLLKPRHASVAPCGDLRAALVLRDNLRFRQTFERAYLYG